MIEVRFVNCYEIRMGSPYNVCDIELNGTWVPRLPTRTWQDKCAQSPDGRYLALVYWDVSNNVPGFHTVVLDTVAHTVSENERIKGCCDDLWWDANGLRWKVF